MATQQRMTVAVKPVTESKTVWLAAVTMIMGALVWAGVVPSVQASPEHIETIVGSILGVVGILNMVLRLFFTKNPLTTNADVKDKP